MRTPNKTLWIVIGAAFTFLLLALYTPWAAGVLRFSALPAYELAAACALGLLSVLWFEVVKLARRASVGVRSV